jgi:hypothetical protein
MGTVPRGLSSVKVRPPWPSRIPTPWLRILPRADGTLVCEGHAQAVIGHQLPEGDGQRPGGVYVQWDWDGQTLRARNDRAGMGQLLYAPLRQNRGIALSPHVGQLLELGADRELDDEALSILLRLGFHLGVDTPFRFVRALPPQASMRWRPGELQVVGEPHLPQPQGLGRDVAVERFIELFRQSIQRRPPLRGATVVPLTGGQDSRHIVFELCQQRTPPDLCVTVRPYVHQTYDDAAVAAEIAARLGIPHERIDLRRSLVAEDFRKYRRIGPMSDEGGWTSAMLDRLLDFRCAYDGIAGDMLTSGYLAGIVYTPQIHEWVMHADWGSVADLLLNHFSASEQALTPLLARVSFRDSGRAYVRERLIAELSRFQHAAHPLAMFMLNNRTRREIAMMSWLMCAQVSPYYAPYTDEELYSFLASLPAGEFACGQWFHRAALNRAYPQWAELPYFDKSLASEPGVSRLEAVRSIAELNWYAARRLPALWGLTARWGLRRLATRAGANTAPRRVVQHLLALEQLLRHGRYA